MNESMNRAYLESLTFHHWMLLCFANVYKKPATSINCYFYIMTLVLTSIMLSKPYLDLWQFITTFLLVKKWRGRQGTIDWTWCMRGGLIMTYRRDNWIWITFISYILCFLLIFIFSKHIILCWNCASYLRHDYRFIYTNISQKIRRTSSLLHDHKVKSKMKIPKILIPSMLQYQ